jgi:hypothetical protein
MTLPSNERFLGVQAVSEVPDSPNSNPTCVTSSFVSVELDSEKCGARRELRGVTVWVTRNS